MYTVLFAMVTVVIFEDMRDVFFFYYADHCYKSTKSL